MANLPELLKKRFLDNIRAVQPPSRYKVLVADPPALKILSASCQMYDILEEQVTLVENITKQRQPYPSLEAIYLLTPVPASFKRLIEDFSRPQGPMYAAAHLIFTSGLSDKLFEDLNTRLKSSGVGRYIKGLKEIYVDFIGLESKVFSLETPYSFFGLFSPSEVSRLESDISRISKQLLSVCVTLGENPVIRYHRPLDAEGKVSRTLPYKIALNLQQELDGFCKVNPNFPPKKDPAQPRATLIVLDRTIDLAAPILHEFTYQAMANDLLPIENGKYTYAYSNAEGDSSTKEFTLEEADDIYNQIRHMHIAECTDYLVEKFNKFLSSNKAIQKSESGQAASLRDMKEMLTALPQFQEDKAKYSAHITIAQNCMNAFENSKLNQTGLLEQNLATGETVDGEPPKTVMAEMVPLLDDEAVGQLDRVRLLMLYIVFKENGVSDDDMRKLLEHSRISPDYREAINNLSLLGVTVSKSERINKTKKKRERRKAQQQEDTPYELSRYIPMVKRIAENEATGNLDTSLYPFVVEQQEDETISEGLSNQPVTSLRTTKPGWHKKSEENRLSGRIIVFIAGGLTFSEIRTAYEIFRQYDREVIIGSTHTITPKEFVKDMRYLRTGPPRASPSSAPSTGLPQSIQNKSLPVGIGSRSGQGVPLPGAAPANSVPAPASISSGKYAAAPPQNTGRPPNAYSRTGPSPPDQSTYQVNLEKEKEKKLGFFGRSKK
ncbi:uncharacterized protein VTP21DRAFT_3965 [Calcarisporiella thermophila]|uniref:uncharacterized protein n=1 Tax=Calcarisporiella thermophila TaxID=911321 RepID=UPI0037428239